LKALDLQRVSFMDPHLLYHLGNLTKLIIHSCKNILTFPQNFLAPLKHLEHLEVFGNPDLRIIPSGFFDTNIHLKVVNMSSNRLELFTSGMFSNLVNLQELVLNHNYFQAVPPDLFAHNAKLKILRWNQVPGASFTKLTYALM
jgi:Leucine-rich repeat (LRR) protein